ncbi:uncharacterized protein LOC129941590 isoform X1 [Eupeodes corollae]|uniref:uncharacterized protein LOC129941590 isoform X1 n=2 Tax=Eupeodes corollae TaxID=290404 RepID=UPI00249144F2|nr:uncharacterized protein LOC129941590 isoform X1 [Eupeodes corollae]
MMQPVFLPPQKILRKRLVTYSSTNHDAKDCSCTKSIPEKKKMLVAEGRCFRCCKKGHNSRMCRVKGITCKTCNGHHATSMCDPSYCPKNNIKSVSINNDSAINLYTSDRLQKGVTYLQTACAYASSESSTFSMFVRIVMDGGRQLSFIKSTLARRLNLPIVGEHNLSVITFGSEKPKPSKICNRVRLVLRSQFDDQAVVIDAIEVPAICFDGLSEPTNDRIISTVKLTLADNRAHGPTLEDGISVLIGADAYWQFATGEHKRLTERLTAINTILGWTIQGPSTTEQKLSDSTCATSLNICACEDIQRLWRLDGLGILSEDKKEVSGDVSLHISRKGDRFEASLPWKAISTPLHNNRTGAFIRMQSLVRKLCASGKIIDYDEAMNEMISAGIAERVSEDVVGDVLYYLPHRPVYREDKETTKLRIVFDASAHAPNYLSLNDVLEVGENFLTDLLLILLNFRVGKVGLISDIEKAFLQIMLKPSDRDSHRFLWFAQKIVNEKILPAVITYRMTRLTFGVKSSPYILGGMIQELIKEALLKFQDQCASANGSDEEMERYRFICELLKKSFYMDDFVASMDDEIVATQVYREANGIFESASMKLRKWNSNNACVRNGFSEDEQLSASPKVLGLRWVIATDELQVDLNSVLSLLNSVSVQGTKRSVLRIMAKIFDPFGVLSPWTVRLKILFQNIWRKKLNWDEELSSDLQCIWETCRNEINELNEIGIPRHLSTSREGSTQVHVFADASQHAFGAVAYARTVQCDGQITVRFICSKNRVAPLKNDGQNELTIPKLELTAALVAARLHAYLKENLRITISDTFLWSDSQIVLYWIMGSNKRWKPYVENRVKEIKALSKLSSWRHCPGVENPADLLTRGISASSLIRSSVWFNGPPWLMEDKSVWPCTPIADTIAVCGLSLHADDENENAAVVKLQFAEPVMNAKEFSTWTRLLRITACFFRSIDRFRKREFDFISAEDIANAESYWIHQAQNQHFRNEISSLQAKKGMPSNSKLLSLFPFLDDADNFLRVGGRLQEVEANQNLAHPIILPKSSHITKLIVIDLHARIFHGGTSAVLSNLRSKYWIIRGRQLVKNIIKNCFVCKMLRGQAASQPFAPVPKDRMLSAKAFDVTGIDFAGPLYVLDVSGQRKKFYILLFTCAAVRAVHLEYTNDLTTESCILAIRRFIARRGAPRIIYSDNATTFKKASSEFKQLSNVRTSERFLGFLSDAQIRWKFIVERAPWWGGFWERLVGVVKTALRGAVRRSTLNNDQLHTLLTEVECVVNSRPLTYMGDDPLDLAPLTPANFLNGGDSGCRPSEEITCKNRTGDGLRKQWKERLLFLAAFKRRWFKEYLLQLRTLHHAKNCANSSLQVGDVVLVEDSSLPRPLWHLAVIQTVFPGRDGKIRACEIRLSSGSILRRPIQLLYPLEISNSSWREDVKNL